MRTDWILALLLLLPALGGCGARATVDRSYGEDPIEGGETYSQSVSLEANDAEAALRDAAALVRARDFDQAITLYQRLYRDASLSDSVRAEALLRWAQAEGNLLNPERDLDAAIARVELVIEKFGRSDLRLEAEETLERMRSIRDSGSR